MADICLGFEVHQPLRINSQFEKKWARGKDIRELYDIYFDNVWNREILERVAEKCYLPANRIILENIDRFSGQNREFKVTYSISGVLAYQCKKWASEVLDSFRKLAQTDCVEFLDQTYYHSLASLFSSEKGEFREQVQEHRDLMKDLFDYEPEIFENTEFIYNNSITGSLKGMGYEGVLTEGADRVLGWRSPNYVYEANDSDLKVLTRNYMLSDDIAFRFSNHDWEEWPLTAEKYASWLSEVEGQCVNIFVDYETFGEHQYPETGILDFLRFLPEEILNYPDLDFVTPSEAIEKNESVGKLNVGDFDTISWADIRRSTDAWLGNPMQEYSFERLKELESKVRKTNDEDILKLWRFLQISDHLYYMYTEPGAPMEVHGYFSQQPPGKVFQTFNNILNDFEDKVDEKLEQK